MSRDEARFVVNDANDENYEDVVDFTIRTEIIIDKEPLVEALTYVVQISSEIDSNIIFDLPLLPFILSSKLFFDEIEFLTGQDNKKEASLLEVLDSLSVKCHLTVCKCVYVQSNILKITKIPFKSYFHNAAVFKIL